MSADVCNDIGAAEVCVPNLHVHTLLRPRGPGSDQILPPIDRHRSPIRAPCLHRDR